jgi:hypothetical protein
MSFFEKATNGSILAAIVAVSGVVGGFLGAVVTGYFNLLGTERTVDAKMVDIAIGILSDEPSPETHEIREWAVEVVTTHSGIKLSEDAAGQLFQTDFRTFYYPAQKYQLDDSLSYKLVPFKGETPKSDKGEKKD